MKPRNGNLSRWIIPVVVLPGTALVFVPLLIVWLSHGTPVAVVPAAPDSITFWLAFAFGVPGAVLSLWAMKMFFRFGEGTPAPWDPPKHFVVEGPYRHVRNPMLSGVVALQIAEAFLLQSWPLAIWAGVFFVVNTIYFRHREEPGLLARFGDDYRIYCQNVRRWLPRLKPWDLPEEGS